MGSTRPFRELNVGVSGVQSHTHRTGLSQVRNLYFVAYGDRIWVYQPQFPTQVLRTRPDLILTLPVSRENLTGFVDVNNPHAINQLVVGDLGGEEILACVCDDGDVVAYQTQKILATIERRDAGDHVKAFFNENVGKSAWGLAIHKSARMIAVSANTKEITVFAFALATEGSNAYARALERNALPSESVDWVPIGPNSPTHTSFYPFPSSRLLLRQQNYRITLRGHGDNIPSVAFYNSQDDTLGRWLVSTDIDCAVVIWDVWCREVVKRTGFVDQIPWGQFGHTISSADASRGWGVLCLDPRSFKPTSGHEETFGCDPVPHHGKHVNMWGAAWDITGSKGEVRDSSFWHPSYSMYDEGEVVFGDMFENVPSVYDDDDEEEDDGEFPYWEMVHQGTETQNELGHETDGQDHVSPHAIHDSEDAEALAIIYASLTNIYDNQSQPAGGFSPTIHHSNPSIGQQFHIGDTSMAHTDEPHAEQLLKPYPSTLFNQSADLQDELPDFPVLFSTEKHIRLLESPTLRASTICRKALEQNIPPHLHWLNPYSRLNMIAQIPDLSLAAVASQSGRVALLTLTTSPSTIPDEKFAFRLEAILPFKSQEKDGLRPDVPLVGLAVAPIQGRELAVDREAMTDVSAGLGSRSRARMEAWRRVEGKRRHRLMVMYHCGTVLSYELGRDGERVSVEGTGGQLLAL
ncbi:hypothetical protein FGG08_003172 [Glutinoglossum americanum]|uniref:Uncharacterized protein n=1 Tax=Glutinoglossum americanum TaxID=1670608 RepID=A0A9P8L4Z5_9PEZI|nr:hypothetical protein FGG08_003172 [Glutinoglossum americanum]